MFVLLKKEKKIGTFKIRAYNFHVAASNIKRPYLDSIWLKEKYKQTTPNKY